MKKTLLALAVIIIAGLGATYYAIKQDVHKTVFGDGAITDFIEKLRDNGKQPVFTLGQIGKTAPEFSLPAMSGGKLQLSDYKGKVILLNFWASWCPPCRAEIPGFIKVQEEYKDKPFTILGVAIEDKEAVAIYMKDVGLNYPTAYGVEESMKTAADYGDPDGALPYSVLIDKSGKIQAVFSGFLSENKLKALIDKNL